MKRKNETDALSEKIILLQNKHALELKLLQEQFHITYESLKLVNFIKNVFQEVASSPDIKNNIVNNVIGLTTGYLSRKILLGVSHNPIKKILGALLQFAISNVVAKHSDTIKSTGENILNRILKFRNETKQVFHHNGNGA